MTGTVHFDVPDTAHSTSRSSRPFLSRNVSMEEADNSVNEIHESLPRKAAVRLYRQISSGFNSRTIRCILVVSLGLNLIFAILVGIFVGFWQSSRDFNTDSSADAISSMPTREQLYSCFPCSEEGIPGLQMSVRSKNGVCCAKDSIPGFERSNRYLQLTRDYVRGHCPDKQDTEWPSGNQKNDPPSAAHLTLDVSKSKKNLQDLHKDKHYLSWNVKDDTGISFISSDLRYVNGTITIPTQGRYHIYTHLTFDTYSNNLDQEQLVVDHSIARISRGSPTYLVLDKVNLQPRVVKSSDLEGTFELRQGDVVKVIVSYPSYLYNLPQTNVFGLFKLVSG
ncbi:uncharacterized protein [Littorina saxatilis]|uniref:THD domain-containing protein n=2 Tax=Littorina saxatilis TaxID=31220 RepID=A0AAN9AQ07_9CAEN